MKTDTPLLESPTIRTYRELMRVDQAATQEAIKKAYRNMAMVYHPDHNSSPGADAVFVRIKEAYEILSSQAKVRDLNRKYAAGKRSEVCVPELGLNLGSFFGHRFSRTFHTAASDTDDWSPWDQDRPTLQIDERGNSWYYAGFEAGMSILDDAAFDLVEVIFAGSFNASDLHALTHAFRDRDFGDLPWFALNNEGIVHFLDGNFDGALRCYEALNRRIANNIVFLYRLGLCNEILAFKHKTTSLLFGEKPNSHRVQTAIRCYEKAIAIGEARMHAQQKCMTIRKTLADLLEYTGKRRRAHRIWSQISHLEPESAEAKARLAHSRPRIAGLLGPRS